MTEKINLKNIEIRAWKSIFQDGLWDIFLGIILINFGLAPFIEEILDIHYLIPYVITLVFSYIIFYYGKKFITIPRLGYVEFGEKRKEKRKKTSLILAISVLIGFVIYLVTFTPIKESISFMQISIIFFCINAIIVFSLMAYLLDFNRLYIYGWFFGGGIALVETFRTTTIYPYHTLIGFGIFGIIMMLIGSYYLITFVRMYSPKKEEMINDSSV